MTKQPWGPSPQLDDNSSIPTTAISDEKKTIPADVARELARVLGRSLLHFLLSAVVPPLTDGLDGIVIEVLTTIIVRTSSAACQWLTRKWSS